jgi:hypothetical protein
MLMVGGPPISTVEGIARLKSVGSRHIFRLLLTRPGLGMPTTWQPRAGWEMCENGSPSTINRRCP